LAEINSAVTFDKLPLWRLFVVGRSAVTGVILSILVIINSFVVPLNNTPLFVLATLQFAANAFYLYLLKRQDIALLGYLSLGLEIVLITWLVFFLGPDGYAFILAYLWPIIVGGWLIGRHAVLGLTLFSAIAYAVLVLTQQMGIVYVAGLPEPGGIELSLLLNLPYLFFIALLLWVMTTEMEGHQRGIEQRNDELYRVNQRLRSLVRAGEEVAGCLDLHQLSTLSLALVSMVAGQERAALALNTNAGLEIEKAIGLPVSPAEFPEGSVLPTEWSDQDPLEDNAYPIVYCKLEGDRAMALCDASSASLIHVAMRSSHGLAGMLTTAWPDGQAPDSGDLQVLQILGHQLGIAIENARLLGDLQHERNLLSGILGSMGEGVYVVSEQGAVLLANRAAGHLLGVEQGNALPEWLRTDRLVDTDGDGLGELRLPGARMVTYEKRTISITRAELDATGRVPASTIYVARDITEQAQAIQMRSDFVAYASHELRTPLTTIKMLVRLLLMDTPEESKQYEYLTIIDTQARRQTRLVNNLLDFARLEAGKYELELEEVYPVRVVRSAVSVCRPLAEDKGLDLLVDCDEALAAITSNEGGLEQVLINLLSNAIKFTNEGGCVSLSCSQREDQTLFVVQDTGIGMSAEQLERIFNKFYTVHNPSKRGEGTGLGLMISSMIIEKLEGRIDVAREERVGTRFVVSLPMIAGPVERDEAIAV